MLRKLGKDVAAYGGADFLFRAAQFLVLPVYAHLLSVADFGIMAMLVVSATLLGMLLNLGINNSVQRFYFDPGTDKGDRPMLVSTGLAQLLLSGAVTLGIAFLILSPLRGAIERDYGIEWVLVMIVLLTILPEQVAQYCMDAVRLQFAPLKFCTIALVKNLLGILLGLWFLLRWNMGIEGILLGTLMAAAAAVPIGLFMIRRDLAFRFDRDFAWKVFLFGYPYVFAGAAYWVFGSMDRWMLIELSDVEQVGLFSIGVKFAGVITFLMTAFSLAWSPFAYRVYAEEERYREFFARILSGWTFLLAFIGLAIALFANEVMMLLTPPDYWPAAPVLSIAAAGLVLYGTTVITGMGISIEKRTMLLTYGAWLAAIANMALNFFLIPRFGAIGSAVATFCSYAILTSSFLYWGQKLHPIPLERGKLLYSCALIALTLAAALVHIEPGIAVVLAKSAILAAAIGGAFAVGIVDRTLYGRILGQVVA